MTTMATTLPARRLTSFIGRDADLASLVAAVRERRLVTLLGSGGVGKTRLAEEAVHTLAQQGTEIAWAELAPIAEPAGIGEVVARAVGIGQVPAGDVLDHVITRIADRPLTLAIDNAEHLIDDVATTAHRLLTSCPHLHMLITSREVLALDGEATVQLPTLTPDHAHQLFVQRQQLVTTTPSTPVDPAVARICRRLDGIPLAIELAAARTRAMTPAQIADALDDRFTLLTGGPRTALAKQQTLEASVAWSVDLLDPDQRTLLAVLSVFAGGFTLDAAVEVVGDALPEVGVRTGVLDLVDRSLVHPARTTLDQPRFRLLETIRAYADQRLAEHPGLGHDARTRHAARHFRQVRRLRDELRGPDWRRHLTLLDEEVADLSAAIAHAARNDKPTAAVLIGAVSEYWVRRPQIHAMTDLALELMEETGATSGELSMAAEGVTQMLGWHSRPEIMDRLERWIADGEGVADAEPHVVGMHGLRAWVTGERALPDETRLLARADALADPWVSGDTRFCFGVAHWKGGDLRRAVELFDTASRELESLNATMNFSNAFPWAALILLHGGRLDRAERLMELAWQSITDSEDAQMAGIAVCIDGILGALRGDVASARDVMRTGVDHCAVLNPEPAASLVPFAFWGLVEARAGLGYADFVDWDAMDAAIAASYAANVLIRAALERLHADNPTASVPLAEDAVATAEGRAGADAGPASASIRSAALLVLAQAHRAASHPEAPTSAHVALQRHVDRELVFWPDALDVVAAVDADAGRHERAARLLGAADRRRQELGTVRFPPDQRWVDGVNADLRCALGDEAYQAAHDAGLQLDQEAAMALARTGRDERPVQGWDALTPAEQETARLAAEGLSNPDIADRLFISRNTVKTHLSAAYRKLAVNNRTELATVVTQRLVP